MAEVAVSRQMFVDILSLIARPGAPPAPMWGGWRSDATADKRERCALMQANQRFSPLGATN